MKEILNYICMGFCQETVLIISIFVYFILSFLLSKKFFYFTKPFAILSVTGALISSLKIQIIPTYYAFNGAFISNFYTVFFKILLLLCTLFILISSKNILFKNRSKCFDYFTSILFATLGAITLVASNDFLTMYISLELMGISSFILLLFSKSYNSKKSAITYYITKIVASVILLLGISFIYLSCGSLNFDVIYSILNQENELSLFFDIGCILCALGLTFYLGIIPFSNWIPDAYEKIKNNTALFLSIIPTIAVFGLTSRLIIFIFQYTPMVQALLFIIGILSIYKGILSMLREENLKRFFGYSITAQSGFILLGLCLSNPYALSSSLFYIITCIFATIGLWTGINIMNLLYNKVSLNDLKGFIYSEKTFSLALIICLFSLAGLPITGGFLAKIYVFESIIKCTNLYLGFLAIVMVISVVGIYTYLRPVIKMFEQSENQKYTTAKFNLQKITLYLSATITVIICLMPDKIIQLCQFIAYQL